MIYVHNETSAFLLAKRVIIKKCVSKRKRTNKFLEYRYFIENPKSTPLQFRFVFIKHSLHQSGLIQKIKK